MKFGKQIEYYAKPEWSEYYVDYKRLKNQLEYVCQDRKAFLKAQKQGPFLGAKKTSSDSLPRPASDDNPDLNAPLLEDVVAQDGWEERGNVDLSRFNEMLTEELEKINDFFLVQVSTAEQRVADVIEDIHRVCDDKDTTADQRNSYLERIPRILTVVLALLEDLDNFSNLNWMAFYKIFKKRDKLSGLTGLEHDLNLISTQPFRDQPRVARAKSAVDDALKLSLDPFGKNPQNLLSDLSDANRTKSEFKSIQETLQRNLTSRAAAVASLTGGANTSSWRQAFQTLFSDAGNQVTGKKVGSLQFYFGCVIVLLVDVMVLAILPTHGSYAMSNAVVAFAPMMRLSLCLILVIWVCAAAVGWMDAFRVNFRFLLGIDPALSHLEAHHIVRPALILSLVWLAASCAYLLDVKYCLLLLPDTIEGKKFDTEDEKAHILMTFGHRLLLYPVIIWLALIISLFWPSNTFKSKYKRNILLTVVSCLLVHPTSNVTFLENVVGDVLTSLPKPLIDVANIICFLSHRATTLWISIFGGSGDVFDSAEAAAAALAMIASKTTAAVVPIPPSGDDFFVSPSTPTAHESHSVTDPVTCSSMVWLRPIITIIPFYIRLMQCFARYLATPAVSNSFPSGHPTSARTTTSILRTSPQHAPQTNQRIINLNANRPINAAAVHLYNIGKYTSSILVVFAGFVRWEQLGVGMHAGQLFYVLTYLVATIYSYFWDVIMDWGLVSNPDSFLRPKSLYPAQYYIVAAFLNLLGRLSWTLTLVPPVSLGWKGINPARAALNSELLVFIISVIEILRRGMWATLRIEHEHLTNASRYRAMLWVPPVVDHIKNNLNNNINNNDNNVDGKTNGLNFNTGANNFRAIEFDKEGNDNLISNINYAPTSNNTNRNRDGGLSADVLSPPPLSANLLIHQKMNNQANEGIISPVFLREQGESTDWIFDGPVADSSNRSNRQMFNNNYKNTFQILEGIHMKEPSPTDNMTLINKMNLDSKPTSNMATSPIPFQNVSNENSNKVLDSGFLAVSGGYGLTEKETQDILDFSSRFSNGRNKNNNVTNQKKTGKQKTSRK